MMDSKKKPVYSSLGREFVLIFTENWKIVTYMHEKVKAKSKDRS